MFRAIAFAAALTALPFSSSAAPDPVEDATAELEAAAEAFEARMEAFGARAEAIGADESLTEAQREARIMEIFAEYEPDISAFTSLASQHAAEIAVLAMAQVDIEAEIARAMQEADIEGTIAEAASAMALMPSGEGRVVLADEMEGLSDLEQAELQAEIAAAVAQAAVSIDYASLVDAVMAEVDVERLIEEALAGLEDLDALDFDAGEE